MFALDLAIGTMTIGALSMLAFWAGRKVDSYGNVLFVTTIFLAIVFSNWLQGSLGWATLIPYSSAVLLSNFTPILIAFAAGFICSGLGLRRRNCTAAVTGLTFVAVTCLFAPLVRPAFAPPRINVEGALKGIVVLQTHESTCAPASAATLLKLHGIETNEAFMADACLTSEFGTEALGLYRGLKLGCRNNGFDARIADSNPHLWSAQGQLPNVALVRFGADEYSESINTESQIATTHRPRFLSGEQTTEDGHAVVLLDHQNGKWIVADPAVGLVTWSEEEFQNRFTGDAIYLLKD